MAITDPAVWGGADATVRGEAFAANHHVPLHQFGDDPWPASFEVVPGSNHAVFSQRLGASVGQGDWSLAVQHRAVAGLTASADTAVAHYLSQTNQLFAGSRNLQIQYRLVGWESRALSYQRYGSVEWSALPGRTSWGLSLVGLRGARYREESTDAAFVTDGVTASLNGSRVLADTDLRPSSSSSVSAFHPFAEQSVPTHGLGYAIDVSVRHHLASGGEFWLIGNDLMGRMRWRDVPTMRQDFAITGYSAGVYESSGAPAISGYHRYADQSFRLPVSYEFGGAVPVGPRLAMSGSVQYFDGLWVPEVAINWSVASRWRASLAYESRWNSVQLHMSNECMGFGVRSDSFKLTDARALGVEAWLKISRW